MVKDAFLLLESHKESLDPLITQRQQERSAQETDIDNEVYSVSVVSPAKKTR